MMEEVEPSVWLVKITTTVGKSHIGEVYGSFYY